MNEQRSQIKSKKMLIGIVFGTLAVVAGLLILLPILVNTDEIRTKIEETASQAIDGQVDFKKIRLGLLPRPHIILYQGRIAIQDSIQGKWLELTMFPKLRSLLGARLEVASLKLKQPDFGLSLPISSWNKSEKGAFFQEGGDLSQQIKKGLGALFALAKDGEMAIDDGHLRVLEQDKVPLEWHDIIARLRVTERRVAVDLTCSFSFIQKIVLNGELNSNSLDLSGKAALKGFGLHQFMNYWRPDSELKIIEGNIDLTLKFQSKDWSSWQGDFDNRTSLLKVQYDTHQAEIGPAILKGRFNLSPSQVLLHFDALDLENPKLSLGGKLLVDSSETAGVHLQVTGQNINVNALRATALSLGGPITDVREVFDIVKGGHIPTIKAEVQSKNWADLLALERWRINGEMTDGAIFIPAVNLDLTGVYGLAIVENGILSAENIRADYGKSHGREGSLKIGLVDDSNLFHLEIEMSADLAPLPSILYRVVDSKEFKSELSRIEDLNGMGTGKLILGENLDDIRVQIDVAEFNLNARYNRLPHPLSLKGGRFQFKDNESRVSDLRFQMQNTYFSKIFGRINWGDTVEFDLQTGSANIALSEIYPWLKDHADFAESLKTIEAVNGSIAVSALDLKGPFSSLSAWRFNIFGDIQYLAMKSIHLPKTLVLPQGHFKLVPESLTLTKGRAQMLDLKTDFSLRVTGYMEGINKLNFNGDGKIGSDSAQWLSHKIKIPDQYHLNPPIDFYHMDIEWNRSSEISVAGGITTSNGPTVTADIHFSPDEIDIRRLTVHDDASDAEFVLKHKSKAKVTDFSFKGLLTKGTLDQFWMNNQFLEGIIKGDLQAQIDSEHPLNSMVKGNLQARQVFLPFKQVGPLRIDHTTLSASVKKLIIHKADIDWLGNQFELDGHMTFKPKSIFLEMNTVAEEIDLAKLEALFKDNSKKKNKGEGSFLNFLEGMIHIDTERMKYGFYTWTPYRAELELDKTSMTMQINEASLCGIETLGTIKFSQEGVWFEIIPSSQPEDIQHAVGCLTGKSTSEILEGQFQTTGSVNTKGKTVDELLHNLKGDIEITIQDGRIYNMGKVGTFTNILSFLKVNSLLEGDVPDLNSNDFHYKLFFTKYYIQDGRFILTEGHLNSKSLHIVATEGEFNLFNQTLDFNLLVSPFTTVDTVINKIPLIRHIFQGTLIAIPLKVKGDVSNPKVTLLPPSAIGSRTLGILKRTLKAPVKIINSVVTDTSNSPNKDNQEH
jgi:hypothetical protein